MLDAIENLMSQYDHGSLNRRQVIAGLLALATATRAKGVEAAPAVTPALSLNHVHLDVTNLDI